MVTSTGGTHQQVNGHINCHEMFSLGVSCLTAVALVDAAEMGSVLSQEPKGVEFAPLHP